MVSRTTVQSILCETVSVNLLHIILCYEKQRMLRFVAFSWQKKICQRIGVSHQIGCTVCRLEKFLELIKRYLIFPVRIFSISEFLMVRVQSGVRLFEVEVQIWTPRDEISTSPSDSLSSTRSLPSRTIPFLFSSGYQIIGSDCELWFTLTLTLSGFKILNDTTLILQNLLSLLLQTSFII